MHHLDLVAHGLCLLAAEAQLVPGAQLRRLPRRQPAAVEEGS